MKIYKNEITLNKNNRGCYILDTVKGCETCLETNKEGCYGECYAKKIANRYGFDFSKSVDRKLNVDSRQMWLFGLKDTAHLNKILKKIKLAEMPFIRIGEMGDPSENWEHTINICGEISTANKPIVIITKHWKILTDKLLSKISRLSVDICINTSISALDSYDQIRHRLEQFHRLKKYCKSVLRIVTCDFNKENEQGLQKSILQDSLLKYIPNIDTVFRCEPNNELVKANIINLRKIKFLNKQVYASVFNKNTYLGFCKNCPDLCGINTKGE